MFAEDGWLYGGEPAGALGMWLLVEAVTGWGRQEDWRGRAAA